MKKQQFVVIIEQDEDGVYIGKIPDLPGCHTYGNTLEELNKNLGEVITLWTKVHKKMPEPLRFHGVQIFEYMPRRAYA